LLVLEFKIRAKAEQFALIDEAIRTAQFVRNSCLRYWIDNKGVSKFDLNKQCAVLAKEFDWAKKLNSMARQASAERAWFAISRFFDNCKKGKPGKKGYPQFKKGSRSVEYKTSGWAITKDFRYLTLTDGFGIGRVKLKGTHDLGFYSKDQFKRLGLVKRADGYYAQFCLKADREEPQQTTGSVVGLDMGLNHFYTDSNGATVDNPRYLKKSEKALKRLQRRVSQKVKGSKNRRKAINRLGHKHLKVSRQRKDFAIKTARCVVHFNDVVVIEDLQVSNMVKNHKLAKSISDASWSMFRQWLEYFARVFNHEVIAVPPQWTSQDCSNCGERVQKSLSTRTHQCSCGTGLDRDHNAAINILAKALDTEGHSELQAWGEISATDVEVIQSQHLDSLNQESAFFRTPDVRHE